MKVLGIIAEYNPFHYGHLYHLVQSKKLIKPDYTIAVMSGNFTQRGEAAITDKWIRAKTAVICGIDLVLELPVIYAVQTAELFAYGGIQTLNNTGLVTNVCFGSEIGDIKPMQWIANILTNENAEFSALMKKYIKKGLSYPAARQSTLLDYVTKYSHLINEYDGKEFITAEIIKKTMSGSNAILGIEYLKALKKTNSNIIPITVPRIRSSYSCNYIKKGISSATSIRNEIIKYGMSQKVRETMPKSAFSILEKTYAEGSCSIDKRFIDSLIIGLLRRSSVLEIASWVDVEEGLENRIKDAALSATNMEQLISLVKTRRYVRTRIQRILIYCLLGLTKEGFRMLHDAGPSYLRVLAFSQRAIPLLKRMKETAKVPIITKAAHINRHNSLTQKMFEYDCLATDIYSLTLTNPAMRKGGRDFSYRLLPTEL
jgi:predicted nucleotidyltransferase